MYTPYESEATKRERGPRKEIYHFTCDSVAEVLKKTREYRPKQVFWVSTGEEFAVTIYDH